MIRGRRELQRYTAGERLNHWTVGILFILLALSGLAFFHPAFFPLTMLFGGGPWTRILHPWFGVGLAVFFTLMALRFWKLNLVQRQDIAWLKAMPAFMAGDSHHMPEQDKYNGGQKLLFWGLVLSVLVLLVSGLGMWRSMLSLPIFWVRVASIVHAVAAVAMIGLIMLHIYAAIWTEGTIRAMTWGTVTRAWARYHHPIWFRRMTGQKAPDKAGHEG